MNDEQMLRDLGTWLKDTDAAHADAERITARAMAQVPQVRQRGHWWPLPASDDLAPRIFRRPRPLQPASTSSGEPQPAPSPTMFSALKFVTAGVLVGLVGGFLLAGALDTPPANQVPPGVVGSPSPATTDELLSRATTVEAEPGVLHIASDGIRDLDTTDALEVVAGHDGGMWLLSEAGFLRLGSDKRHDWPSGSSDLVRYFDVAPDGVVWTVLAEEDGRGVVRSLDGQRWTAHEPTLDTRALEIGADGRVWAMWQEPGSEMVSLGYFGVDGRTPVGEWPDSQLHGGDLYPSGTDEIWVSGGPAYREGKPRLYRLVDGGLQEAYVDTVVAADVGPDGTAWFVSLNELIRLDGVVDPAEPESWTLPEAMTSDWGSAADWTLLPRAAFSSAPDGSVWFALLADSGPPFAESHCGGVASFDGTTWSGPFLQDLCIDSIDLADDGSVWLLGSAAGSSDGLDGVFVVDPEVAAAAG